MSIVNQLQAQLVMIRFGNVVERQVEILNERRAEDEPEITGEDFMDNLLASMSEQHGDPDQYGTFAEKLKLFKADVDEEMWEDVKNNPALESMVNEHAQNVLLKRGEACIAEMLEVINEANQEQDEPLTANDLKFVIALGKE